MADSYRYMVGTQDTGISHKDKKHLKHWDTTANKQSVATVTVYIIKKNAVNLTYEYLGVNIFIYL